VEYDSGWININDKCGQYFNITHNLNSTDLIVDIQGRTTPDSGPHQKHYGLTTHIPGWSRTYGGASDDVAYSAAQTSDGGYIIAGCTSSGGEGGSDFWLVKTDGNGKMQWNMTYGSTDKEETTFAAIQTSDGGYAVLGYQHVGYGDWDTLLFKIYANGTQQWNMTYGGLAEDFGESLIQVPDGGYAIGGHTYSFGVGFGDAWLVKTYANGSVQWSKTYGDWNSEVASCVIRTSDGGYALGGIKGPYMGVVDMWILKTDADGNEQWNKTYGGTGDDVAYAFVQTADGGYTLAGKTTSFGAGGADLWLVKTDVDSGLAWTDSTADTITLYRGATDPYWNFVRVRIWKTKTP
jgi:hypothetical protein